MKSRIKLSDKVSKNQQKMLQAFCDEQFHKNAEEHTRRILKIACIALNESFSFGAERCSKFLDRITEISNKHIDDEVFWVHVDRRLKQMHLIFQEENYEKMEER